MNPPRPTSPLRFWALVLLVVGMGAAVHGALIIRDGWYTVPEAHMRLGTIGPDRIETGPEAINWGRTWLAASSTVVAWGLFLGLPTRLRVKAVHALLAFVSLAGVVAVVFLRAPPLADIGTNAWAAAFHVGLAAWSIVAAIMIVSKGRGLAVAMLVAIVGAIGLLIVWKGIGLKALALSMWAAGVIGLQFLGSWMMLGASSKNPNGLSGTNRMQ